MEKVVASLASIGECMLELNATDTLNFKRSFAGDTYNTAVYAKRWHSRLNVHYISAIGTDNLSNEMLAQWKAESLNTQYIARTADAQLGIYAITRDDKNQRCVSYWRKESAASQLMSLLKQQNILAELPKFDYVYFTGISLGILSDQGRTELLELIEKLRNQGSTIVFDPNYREKLWHSDEDAISWLTKAYQLTDIALPGMTDHKAVFKHETHDEVAEFLRNLGCKEIIVKNAQDGIYVFTSDEEFCYSVRKDAPCIDTTAAGDSFAGTYIAARMAGDDVLSAVEAGADVAISVVKHVGAITH